MKFYCEGEQHDNRHCENYVDQCGPCRRYQAGKMPPHYPVPAIALTAEWICIPGNSILNGVQLRNSQGWCDWSWDSVWGSESHTREPGQCELCGSKNHTYGQCMV